jgi:hypothetical protein
MRNKDLGSGQTTPAMRSIEMGLLRVVVISRAFVAVQDGKATHQFILPYTSYA